MCSPIFTLVFSASCIGKNVNKILHILHIIESGLFKTISSYTLWSQELGEAANV